MHAFVRVRARVAALAATAAVAVLAPLATAPAAAAQDTSWVPAAGAVPTTATYAYVVSNAGDYIGRGKTYSYTPATTDLNFEFEGGSIRLGIEGDESWDANFVPPSGVDTLVKGAVYTDATRYPFQSDSAPGLDFSGEGRGCNNLSGWYAIDDVTYQAGKVATLKMRFEQRCESSSAAPLRGQVAYDASAPIPGAPTPTLVVPALWSPPAGAVPAIGSSFYMASQAGDYIGKGKTYLYTDPSITWDGGGATLSVRVDDDVDWWYLDLVASNRADALTAGYYANLGPYPFHNRVRGGFDVEGNGSGCSPTSWVVIDEIDQRGGTVNDLTLRYEQKCDNATAALRGRMHIEPAPASGAPGVPTGVAAEAVAKGATVTWTAPAATGPNPITGYEVYAYDRGNIIGAPLEVGASARSATVTDLPVGVPHTFKVRAVNALGGSWRSAATAPVSPLDPKPVVTSLSPASGPRTGGTAVQVLGTNLGSVTSVEVGGTSVEFTPVSSTRLDIVAPSIAAGPHDVVVAGPSGASATGPSSVWTATKLKPSAPTGVAGTPRSGAIDVAWTAASSGDDPLTSYTVSATKSGALSPQVTVTAAPSATGAALTGLSPSTTYTVKVVATSATGSSPAASSAPIATPPIETGPFAGVDALVKQQYLDFAGRAATSGEVSAAAAPINAGTSTPESFIAGMRSRTEWAGYRAPVIRLYAAYFDRLPDSGGLTYWANKLKAGTKLSKASSTFAASSEFKRKYGNLSNKDFVLLIYANVLKRTPDTTGVSYWTKKLDAGMARGAVMTNFSESSENKRKTTNAVDVVLVYTGMLRRVPTGPQLAAEVALLDASTPLTDLVGRLLVSPAYEARF